MGCVEGITEYLPVSSTGHLILASSLMGLNERVNKESLDAFNIVIQGGAILAVVGVYRERLRQMLQGVLGRDVVGRRLAMNVTIAFVPAAALGLLLGSAISRLLFFPLPVLSALATGGLMMIGLGRWQRRRFLDAESAPDSHTSVTLEALTTRQAFMIGVLQCFAMWPGTSRSMVTIVGGMLLGMKPKHAAEFSFLLGLPTLTAACAYSFSKDLLRDGAPLMQTLGFAPFVTGLLAATLSAAMAVRWLVRFLNRHSLATFGWYRIVLCVVLALLMWKGTVDISPKAAEPATPRGSPTSSAPSSAEPEDTTDYAPGLAVL